MTVPARADLIREGDPTDGIFLILSGWACRCKVLPDGERQITAYFIPGDLCDQRIFGLQCMDHRIGALTAAPVTVSRRRPSSTSPTASPVLPAPCGGVPSWTRRSHVSGS
ncbi:Crp/Fnr family transcriptional regulator [Microvirga makkahensis]|uniref:Crp/Fnr family transcriptional regulator n=1 Tax=Microvirga makkahensis TaxID=1128670 RepID=UPI001FE73475|nr:cyclic nucleotide-binding domain-containing protein [Microvirga makkahensis]